MMLCADEHMGRASIECVRGCTCEKSVLEGHHIKRISVPVEHQFVVTAAHHCEMKVTVLPDSSSGEHKVKLLSVFAKTTRD
jgi:hypothetical protein